MFNPKPIPPLGRQKPHKNRPAPFLHSARRSLSHGIYISRRHVEAGQQRGLRFFRHLLEGFALCNLSSRPGLFHVPEQNLNRPIHRVFAGLFPGFFGGQKWNNGEKEKEEKFMLADIAIVGVEGELKEIAESLLEVKRDFSFPASEIKANSQRVMETGYFRRCDAVPKDTRDGIRLQFVVEPNPKITGIVSTGGHVLPQRVFEDAMRNVLGKTMNYNTIEAAIQQLEDWYASEGAYAQVYRVTSEDPNVPHIFIRESFVERIDLRHFDAATQKEKKDGEENVKEDVIMRHMGTKKGSVVNNKQAQRDVQTIFATGLFADVKLNMNVSPSSTPEAEKIILQLDVYENKKTGGLSLGAGWSGQSLTEGSLPGFVGNVEYVQKNMFKLGQRLISRMEFGQEDKLFKLEYTEPWILGDRHRTSRTFSVMNTRSSGNPFYGSVESAAGIERFKTVIGRLVGSVNMYRALSERWSGTLGFTAQRITLMDDNSRAIRQDFTRSPVNVSGAFHDIMLAPFVKAACTGPGGTQLVMMAEQTIPVQQDWLDITKCTIRAEKVARLGPVSLVLYAKGGAIRGSVPPYEAFPIGGMNSIRGYREGSVGTARHCIEGTAEIRVPIVSNLQGTLFVDYGSDLDTGSSVIGNPGRSRNKPGKGMGVGIGVRVDSPLGPLRLEWAWNDQRSRLFHAGFGDNR